MDLDEQIAEMETITEPTTVTEWISLDSRYAILASLRELKRLREVVAFYADENNCSIARAALKESPDGQ